MIRLVIIGSGNVAQHLIQAFQKSLVQVVARHPETLNSLSIPCPVVTSMSEVADADVYLIAVSDHAIAALAQEIPGKGKLVVHTSGATGMHVLPHHHRKGVFYPLQTFTKGKPLEYSTIPFCLEAETTEDYAVLEQLARTVSHAIYPIDEKQRLALHVAAVFVCNFTNHLYQVGADLCAEHHISFDVLKPLILETAAKVQILTPAQAQTGPALRGDTATLERHQTMLTQKNPQEIYQLLTQSIIDHVQNL